MFELLPNEVLEYLFSFLSVSHYPLRQTCTLFKQLVPPLTLPEFRDRVYEAGNLTLVQCYNLPCSSHNLETILRLGHEGLYKRVQNKIHPALTFLVEACVEGRNEYIINDLLSKCYVGESELLEEACRQNYLDMVKRMYATRIRTRDYMAAAVSGGALDVITWIKEEDKICDDVVFRKALRFYQAKVLRWLPGEVLKTRSKRDMFLYACSAPNMDMFNFLLEIDYIAQQSPITSLRLVETPHAEMMRILVLERGWILDEEMFETALREGCPKMLSCLLELDCPHDEPDSLYRTVGRTNIVWLIKNFALSEEEMLDMCLRGEPENVLFCLVREGFLPESFKNNPDITLAALEQALLDLLEEYKEQGYAFHDDVCLRVENPTSLDWLVENEINLTPDLYHRLVREEDTSLLEKLEQLIQI